jgi:hypothetical protein
VQVLTGPTGLRPNVTWGPSFCVGCREPHELGIGVTSDIPLACLRGGCRHCTPTAVQSHDDPIGGRSRVSAPGRRGPGRTRRLHSHGSAPVLLPLVIRTGGDAELPLTRPLRHPRTSTRTAGIVDRAERVEQRLEPADIEAARAAAGGGRRPERAFRQHTRPTRLAWRSRLSRPRPRTKLDRRPVAGRGRRAAVLVCYTPRPSLQHEEGLRKHPRSTWSPSLTRSIRLTRRTRRRPEPSRAGSQHHHREEASSPQHNEDLACRHRDSPARLARSRRTACFAR